MLLRPFAAPRDGNWRRGRRERCTIMIAGSVDIEALQLDHRRVRQRGADRMAEFPGMGARVETVPADGRVVKSREKEQFSHIVWRFAWFS